MKRFWFLFAVLLFSTYCLHAQKPMEEDPNVMWTYDATQVHSYTTHPSGNVIISFGNKLIEITGNTGQFIREIGNFADLYTDNISQLTTTQDGRIISASDARSIYLIDYQTGIAKKVCQGCERPSFFPDNRLLYRNYSPFYEDSVLVIHNSEENEFKYYPQPSVGAVVISLSKDGKYLATSGGDDDYSYLYLWDAETMKIIRLLEQGEGYFAKMGRIIFSDNSKYVGYGCYGTQGYKRAGYFKVDEPQFKKIYNHKETLYFINEDYVVISSLESPEITEIRRLETDEIVLTFQPGTSLDRIHQDKINNTLLINDYDGLIAFDLNKLLTSVSAPKTNLNTEITYQNGVLSIEADFINPVSISIIDMTGKSVMNFTPQPIIQRLDLPVKLISGSYIVKVGEFSSKIMVVR